MSSKNKKKNDDMLGLMTLLFAFIRLLHRVFNFLFGEDRAQEASRLNANRVKVVTVTPSEYILKRKVSEIIDNPPKFPTLIR